MQSRQGWHGQRGKSAVRLPDMHARSLLQTAVRSSFACQPESSLQKAACYFPLLALASLGFSPTASARAKARWERVAKAEQKRPVPAPDVLTAVCEMSLCALLPGMHGAGYRKVEKEDSSFILENGGALVKLEVLSATLRPGGGLLLAG